MKHFPGEDVIEHILPVHDIVVRIRVPTGERITSVYLAPDQEALPHRITGDTVEVVVPVLRAHAMVVVETEPVGGTG